MNRPLQVLVAEDSTANTGRILAALAAGGFAPTAHRLESAAALTASLTGEAWDAVVLSYSWPAFDAPTALAIVRAAEPDLPFLIVSETVGDDTAVALLRAGANDWVRMSDLARLAPALMREVAAAEGRRTAVLLRAAVTSSDDAVLTADQDGMITSWNAAAERLYGWTSAEAIGRPVSVVVPADRTGEQEVGLEESEGRFRAFTDHAPAAAFIKDETGGYLYVNAKWRSQFDPEPADWAGKTDADFWRPAEAAAFRASDAECLSRDSVVQTEEAGRTADGVDRTWLVLKFPLADRGQRLIGGMAWDITERKRAEEVLATTESRYRRLFESARDGILLVDPLSRKVFDANPYLSELLGHGHEELVGKELWEIGLYRDIEANKQAFRTLQADGYVRYDDLPLATKAGGLVQVEFVSNVYDAGGTRVIQCNIRDLTARKRAEEELRLRDRAIRAVTQGIVITDAGRADSPVIYASPGFERLTGYSAADAHGRNCRFLQGKDTDPAAVARLRAAIRAGESCTVELLNTRKDGTPFWNELSVSPVRDDDGRLTHYIGILSDVTARRSLEAQLRQSQKMEAVGQLAGGVAHDFNNQLTVINGYCDLLLEALPPDAPSRGAMAEILRAGERSAGLTRQLLAFSRQQILAPSLLRLNAVVADAVTFLRRLIGEDVRLTVTAAPDLWAVWADPGQVEQVLMNLAVNARDAMPTGGQLTVETRNVELDAHYAAARPDARPGPHVLLAVSDTGTGMPPEVLARIFEPFFTTKPVGRGTGLGLATAYGIVKQSDGHIAAYSEVGVGTTFKVYLPRAARSAAGSKLIAPRPPGDGCETVLLVEDDDAVRGLARHILAGHGYAVLVAADGEKAVALAAEFAGRLDLLVTDVVMPGLGGRVVAERVAERHPAVKVLYLSGYTDDAVVRHGVLREGVQFLQKPFTPATLAAKVREVLDSVS